MLWCKKIISCIIISRHANLFQNVQFQIAMTKNNTKSYSSNKIKIWFNSWANMIVNLIRWKIRLKNWKKNKKGRSLTSFCPTATNKTYHTSSLWMKRNHQPTFTCGPWALQKRSSTKPTSGKRKTKNKKLRTQCTKFWEDKKNKNKNFMEVIT